MRRDITIYSVENGQSPCFSLPSDGTCSTTAPPVVTIQTGDTVVWNFAGANGNWHNAARKSSTPPNEAWDKHKPSVQQGGTQDVHVRHRR